MKAVVITYIGNEIPDSVISDMVTSPKAPTLSQVCVTKLSDAEVVKLTVPTLATTGLKQNAFAPIQNKPVEDTPIYQALTYINKLFASVKKDKVELTLAIISFRTHHDDKTVKMLDNAMKIINGQAVSHELKVKFNITTDALDTIRQVYRRYVL
jgi:hypothetical protein